MAAFTTIAAGVGLAATAATTGMSFGQARKQKQLQRQAENDAAEMMAEARKKLEVNFYDQLAIQKEPYELERDALLAAGAQAIEAGVESERGSAATAGRVQMAQTAGQREIASAMGQEMLGLEKLSAQEDSRLRDVGINLDLEEVAGAQMAAAGAQEASSLALMQGVQGIVSMGEQVASLAPLYAKTAGARQANKIQGIGEAGGYSQTDIQKSVAELGTVDGVDFSKVASMDPVAYKDFMSGISPATLKKIRLQNPNLMKSFGQNTLTPGGLSSLTGHTIDNLNFFDPLAGK